ncbi:uncharacterized protein I206_102027 [Kwoniella pini CBS 10737]|uniref:Mediator complex subunit 11 n=1 Tax=Kwoniella pini CBS 10737 TaxID=1296096 RepID=A0A1B9HV08_9TREE|nr:uncharacterized protein I206_06881 [Kwoniella pini CBS 10737]OCF47105.1 hypothetical protein I206_06881 [Kwoniella pini CBS 10737]
MASSPSGETSLSITDGLEIESLDSQSLFIALTNVEKAIPELLLCIKPILSHLISSSSSLDNQLNQSNEDEISGIQAREGVEKYMNLLDKIQFILRQTVYYLKVKKIQKSILNPTLINNLPNPFSNSISSSSLNNDSNQQVELGLYSNRIEEKILNDMINSIKNLKDEQQKGK